MKNNFLRTAALLLVAVVLAASPSSCKKEKKDEGEQRAKLLGTLWLCNEISRLMEITKDGDVNLIFLSALDNPLPHGKLNKDGTEIRIKHDTEEYVFGKVKLVGEELHLIQGENTLTHKKADRKDYFK